MAVTHLTCQDTWKATRFEGICGFDVSACYFCVFLKRYVIRTDVHMQLFPFFN